jgi:hypothetical protein
MRDGTELGFRPTGEYWNEYLLDDGSVVRVKVVMTGVIRLDGMYDADGEPVYAVKHNNIMAVSAPEELRRQEGGEL